MSFYKGTERKTSNSECILLLKISITKCYSTICSTQRCTRPGTIRTSIKYFQMIQLLILLVLLYPISSFITTQTTCPSVMQGILKCVCHISFQNFVYLIQKKDSFQEEILLQPLWVCVCCFVFFLRFLKEKKPHTIILESDPSANLETPETLVWFLKICLIKLENTLFQFL